MDSKPLAQSLSWVGLLLAGLPSAFEAILPDIAAVVPPHYAPWVSIIGVFIGTYGIKRRKTTIKGVV